MTTTRQAEPPSPRVFISYSHDSEDHRRHVSTLVEILRSYGVNAHFDGYREVPPPQSWLTWMHAEIEAADFVIVVCTETYENRILNREKKRKGLGTRWEGAIISQEIYEEDNHRFIPVLLAPSDQTHIPYFLRSTSRYIIDLKSKGGLEPLLRHLFNEPEFRPSPLGKRPTFAHPIVEGKKNDVDRATGTAETGTEPREDAAMLPPLAAACASAVLAGDCARLNRPIDEVLLHLRKSVQAFSKGMSFQVGVCRAIIYELTVTSRPGDQTGEPKGDLPPKSDIMVAPIISSASYRLRAPSREPITQVRDLHQVFLQHGPGHMNNDLTGANSDEDAKYANRHWRVPKTRFKSTFVWPIVREIPSTTAKSQVREYFGFLVVDALEINSFKWDRDLPLGLFYAALLGDVFRGVKSQREVP